MADNTNNVFVHPSGQPLHIFVETSEFASRPKLIRDLRRGGAIIAHYPTDAQIILVDLETEAGKQFVDDWSTEPGKVVLRWQWARLSNEAGRALLANDNWGGMRQPAAHNGHGAIVDIEHPLPTPPPDMAGHSQPPANPPITATAVQVIYQGQNIPSTSTAPGPSQPTSSQLPLGTPVSHQTLPQANGILVSAQNPALTPDLVNFVRLLMQNPSLLAQRPLDGQHAPNITIVDPSSGDLAASDGPQASYPGLAASDYMIPSSSAAVVRTPRHSVRTSPDKPSSIPLKRRSSMGGLSMASPSASSRSKGKARAYSPEPPLKRHRSVDSPVDGEDEDNDSVTSGPPRYADEVFTQENGESVIFWVQLETKRRGDLLQMIKKNKGKIVANIVDADLVVLAQNSSYFDHWLKRAVQSKKVAVQSRYIHECIKQSALLDTADFTFGEVSKPRRGRPPSSRTHSSPTKQKSRPTKAKASPSVGSSKRPERPSSSRSARVIESPPPPQQPEQAMNGKWLYTTEELEYIQNYIPILMARDPDISNFAIADKLYQKMPHHSAMSWRSRLTRELSSGVRMQYMERARDIVKAQRKGSNQAGKEVEEKLESPRSIDEPGSSSAVSAEQPADVPEDQHVDADDARDFDFIAQFLANGGADNRSDDEVWELLAKEGPTRTAEEWQKFWVERGAEIHAEVQYRMNAAESAT
ncbi:hypothetical protein DAEQUDRAFT_722438 [Daedalea quercina L-15889]|uniref:BRCT domain-containing protein n=1 Tax=Daedalea quercina L-15889 TaxID=1314783 RepID=A0A165T282_9APHY|nr:hypothetical protein DAEQUDRAFT_722438 [Daedalea quercina L-15889]